MREAERGMSEPTPVYTVHDVAAILGREPGWVAKAASRGEIPSRKVGRVRRFTTQDVADYLDSVREGINPLARNARQVAARRRGSK